MTGARPVKRSLTLRGHRTSVSLEDAFWTEFRRLAAAEGRAINALAAEIDAARGVETNLASAIRVWVLDRLRGADAAEDGDIETLDARGLLCPLPVLKAAKRLRAMAPGARLHLIADDPAAVVDVPHYCAESGNALEADEPHEGAVRYVIRRA